MFLELDRLWRRREAITRGPIDLWPAHECGHLINHELVRRCECHHSDSLKYHTSRYMNTNDTSTPSILNRIYWLTGTSDSPSRSRSRRVVPSTISSISVQVSPAS